MIISLVSFNLNGQMIMFQSYIHRVVVLYACTRALEGLLQKTQSSELLRVSVALLRYFK